MTPPCPLPPNLVDKILLILGRAIWRNGSYPRYLHISFQTGPRGEIKKSYCLDIVCPDGFQCYIVYRLPRLYNFPCDWLSPAVMQNGSEYRERLWYKISTKFPTPFNRMILKKEHHELNMLKRGLNRSSVLNANDVYATRCALSR